MTSDKQKISEQIFVKSELRLKVLKCDTNFNVLRSCFENPNFEWKKKLFQPLFLPNPGVSRNNYFHLYNFFCSGKIDEASRLISKMLDVSSGGERVLSSLQDFLKGERFDESLEMLTLMANLSQRHQVKLVKLFMCGNTALHVEGESEESYARRLVNDMGFVERMRIYSLEIFVSLAERVVALRQQSPLSEVRWTPKFSSRPTH